MRFKNQQITGPQIVGTLKQVVNQCVFPQSYGNKGIMGSENNPYVYGTIFSWDTCGPMLDMIILFLEVPNFDLNRYLWRFMVLVRVQMVQMPRVHGQIIRKKLDTWGFNPQNIKR